MFPSWIGKLLEEKKAAVLTYDKPGVNYDPKGTTFNFETFRKHTQKDLITCAQAALDWAITSRTGEVGEPVILVGHSEGSDIATKSLASLFESKANLAKRVMKLILSGVTLPRWREIENFMIEGAFPKEQRASLRKRFFESIPRGDDRFLIETDGTGSAYLREAFADAPLAQYFSKIADRNPSVEVYFFQGNRDFITPAKYVHQFEKKHPSSLKLHVKYYDSGHNVGGAAEQDMLEASGIR
jgi:pimeloyl-ACP methyl ester carboxylesterase